MTEPERDRLVALTLAWDELHEIERAGGIELTPGVCPCPPNWHRDGWRGHQYPLTR